MIQQIAASVGIGIGLLAGCNGYKTDAPAASSPSPTSPAAATANPPEEFTEGEAAFDRYCAPCHGPRAVGTDRGPTFISRIYEPNHHGDESFFRAVRTGVRAHHWTFGDMPKVEGITEDDLQAIVGYVRRLQRQAGIS